jgi:hypothetical protein
MTNLLWKPQDAPPPTVLPRFGTKSNPNPAAGHGAHPSPGLLYREGTITTPSPEVRETLMGFTAGDTAAQGLTTEQRNHMMGQCTNLDILS